MGFGEWKKEAYILDEDNVGGGDGDDYAAEDGDRAGKETPLPIDHLLLLALILSLSGSSFHKWNEICNGSLITNYE